jgi:hypothetical protein
VAVKRKQKRRLRNQPLLFISVQMLSIMQSSKHALWIMFWLSVVINVVVQLTFHPVMVGGNNPVSLASAIAGRSFALLLLPFIALGIINAIAFFTKKSIRYKIPILWVAWLIFFTISTLSYLA